MTEPSQHIDELIQRAAELVALGQRDAARQLLAEVLSLDSKRVDAWILLSRVTNSVAEELDCLKRVVALDPNDTAAKQRLAELSAQSPTNVGEESSPKRPSLRQSTVTPSVSHGAPRPNKLPAARKPVRKQGRPKISPWWLLFGSVGFACGLVWMVALARPLRELAFGTATPTLAAQAGSDLAAACQRFIDEALRVSNKSCSGVGSNKICYGNNTLQVTLANNATGQFSRQGDIIDAVSLKELSASPLNPTGNEWGIAIFKLLANLPRTAPGQNVTFVVFGNTTLTSAEPGLHAFYFSSEVGRVACDQVPMDGIAVNVPQGGGVRFTVNGAQVTLLGNAALEAHPNESMTVSVLSGSALVSADGVDRYFGAGQQVGVPLGGANGVVASGPPSEPSPLAPAAQQAACTLSGVACNPAAIQTVSPADAQAALQQAIEPAPSASVTPTSTPLPFTATRTQTAQPGATLTPQVSRTPTPTQTSLHTPSASPSATRSPTITATPVGTLTRTSTPTRTATGLFTSSPTSSPTVTATRTITRTPTSTPSPAATATRTQTPTSLPPTATHTQTPTSLPPTDTPTPPPTSTPTDTPLPPTNTPTTAACNITSGGLSTGGTNLSLSVQNNMATTVTIVGASVGWVSTPVSQKLHQLQVGGTLVWNGADNNQPSNLPGGIGWTGPITARQFGAGASQSVTAIFQDPLQSSGYSLTLNFDNGCSVSASN